MANATLRERPSSVQVLPAQGVPHSKLLAVNLTVGKSFVRLCEIID